MPLADLGLCDAQRAQLCAKRKLQLPRPPAKRKSPVPEPPPPNPPAARKPLLRIPRPPAKRRLPPLPLLPPTALPRARSHAPPTVRSHALPLPPPPPPSAYEYASSIVVDERERALRELFEYEHFKHAQLLHKWQRRHWGA